MRPARHSRPIPSLWALLAIFLCTGGTAWADSEDPFAADTAESRGDTQRWVPSIGFFAAAAFHKVEAKLDSTLRGPVDGEDLNSHMRVLGQLEIMTPRLFEGFGDPRLFFRAGAGRSWDTRHNSAKEGDPGPAIIRILPGGLQPPLPAVLGQGSATRVQFSPYLYTAAAGFAFTIPIGERALRIKPSVEYRHGATEIEGLITHVNSIADNNLCPCSVGRLNTNDQQDFDGLGAGLELEFDTVQTGPVMITLFTAGQAYKTLNGRRLQTAATGTFDDGITPIDVSSRVILDEWSFSWGLGVRLRWLPN